jgi:hypothetical protein
MALGISPNPGDGFELINGAWAAGVASGNNATVQTMTAKAGGTQAAATQISANAAIVYVSVVATNADSIMLNFAIAGRVVYIVNAGASILSIYASPVANKANANALDTINGVANGTAYNAGTGLAAGKMAMFVCGTNGKWSAMSGGAA